ncbi:MAG: outer membrane protein assembly factor BamA [Deltaproteobacteria bacterium]|nr:MAG: outer membrane protein assembly factor BamA [Deltaproteobacteria bacterium]
MIVSFFVPISVLALFMCTWSAVGYAQEPVVTVVPFKIYASPKLKNLSKGLQNMFVLRMQKKGIKVTPTRTTNTYPLSSSSVTRDTAVQLAKAFNSSFVVDGSLTQMGKKLSVDVRLFDVKSGKEPFFFYGVADDTDALPSTVDRLVMSIYNKILGVPQVDSVLVEGNRRVEKDAILAVIGTKKGQPFDTGQLDQDLRDVYKMGYFKDVQIETEPGPKGKKVVFKVTEKPSIGRISFEGNKKIKADDLKKELGLKLYSILDENQVKQSVGRLRDFYRKKGYYNAEIEEKTEPLPNNEVQLKYVIKEKKKVFIYKIEFLGNKAFDEDDLKDLMQTSEKGWFSFITDSGYLDRDKLNFDVQKIAAFYHNHGYISAKVGEPKVTYIKGKGLKITIEVEEGEQYKVGNVSVEGDLIQTPEELLKHVRIGKEKEFNREMVRKDMLALRSVYSDEGYAYAEVSPLTRKDPKNKKVNVTYKISKGPKVYFERVNILGNTVTRDNVIRRELKVVEGGSFSGKAMRKSMENLHRLGFFEDVSVETKRGEQKDSMIVDIHVKERPTGYFSAGVGYGSVDKTMLSFQIAENNLLGHGQSLSASAKLGAVSSEYDIRFVEPWFLGRDLSLGIDIYKWSREYDEYTKDSYGGDVSLGFPIGLGEYTKANVKYTYDNADITDVLDTAATAIKEMVGQNVTSSITLGLKRDSRDRPWDTHKGSINSISFEYAGGPLGGDLYFNKYQARSAWYFSLPWDTVFLAQGRWGWVVQRSGGKLPVFEKFTLGGINTVRGFDYASISPRDPATGDKIGGEKMMVYNLEYRFPLQKEQGVVGVVFFDAGNVFEKEDDWTFSGIRRSVGAGIRWYSPVGPLRLEYGKNLDPRDDEPSSNWDFTIGGTF